MSELGDRERILMMIIDRLRSTMLLGKQDRATGVWRGIGGEPAAHFACRDPKPGDVVLCTASFTPHPWLVSRYIEPIEGVFGGAVLAELGTGRLCQMHNNGYAPLEGMHPSDLLEGKQRRLWAWSRVAVQSEKHNSKADYFTRWRGCDFAGDLMQIRVGPHMWTDKSKRRDDGRWERLGAATYTVPWSNRTRLRDIVVELHRQGFPPPEYPMVVDPPEPVYDAPDSEPRR